MPASSGDSYFETFDGRVEIVSLPYRARWRSPQRGALASLVSHWSRGSTEPALIALPTGVGKTAVASAAPFILQPRRALVVVPSVATRDNAETAFSTLGELTSIGAIDEPDSYPSVTAVKGRVSNWDTLADYDVVVALPNSISPAHYESNPPPEDLFDLLIIDEAHHAPARTWKAILDHFSEASSVLLTATPRRADGKRVPGDLVYHYPLRRALDEALYQPIRTEVLEVDDPTNRDLSDETIADRAVALMHSPDHANSTLMVRAVTISRAKQLARIYRDRGVEIDVLHSGLGTKRQKTIQENLRSGVLRAVSVVGMLVEGFNLPSLRILAYHDKHKSVLPTAQIAGRLARVQAEYPQESVIVTARDADVYPELRGAVRSLYSEDADWVRVLPGIIDDEIAAAIEDQQFAAEFPPQPEFLSMEAVHPLRRCVIYEVPEAGRLGFDGSGVPDQLQEGHGLLGRGIAYAAVDPTGNHLVLVTRTIERPKWHAAAGLDATVFDLHIVSCLTARRSGDPGLLMINSDSDGVVRELRSLLDPDETTMLADPRKLQVAFDSLDRTSVSSVGVRNTYGGLRGAPSYKMYAGSGVDRGLRASDTDYTSLGHAMIQANSEGVSYTAGVSTGKSKYWETRYVPIRQYDTFVSDLAERFWFPPASTVGQLLPQIGRGRRLAAWPSSLPLAAELDPGLLGAGWRLDGQWDLDNVELLVGPLAEDWATVDLSPDRLQVVAIAPDRGVMRHIWTGAIGLLGQVASLDIDLSARRGFGHQEAFGDLLTNRPPTIFFSDGHTVIGTQLFDARSRTGGSRLPRLEVDDWDGAIITKEASSDQGDSIHEYLERRLASMPRNMKRRWIIKNDGAGEIADYVVLEMNDLSRIHIGLWHAKASGASTPSVRVTDMQEVIAQAVKSRRWLTDVSLWQTLGRRLVNEEGPKAVVVEGNTRLLEALCGRDERFPQLNLARLTPITTGEVVIAQPGLSKSKMEDQLAQSSPPTSAIQISELLQVMTDSLSASIGTAWGLISA